MSLDVSNIAYLGFRLAPFIIVFYFVFQTVLNFEIRGFIYVAGLSLSCVLIYFCNPLMLSLFSPKSDLVSKNAKCNIISLGNEGSPLSEIPLSIAVYTYTFMYLLMFIMATGDNVNLALSQNIPTLVIFPLLCLFEIFWTVTNNCITQPVFLIIASMVLSGGVAVLWALLVISLKINKLHYTQNTDLGHVCDRPSKTLFRCKPQRI